MTDVGFDFEGILHRILDGCYDDDDGCTRFRDDFLEHYGWEHAQTFNLVFDKHNDLPRRAQLEETLGELVEII
jgi:hypothetical protein